MPTDYPTSSRTLLYAILSTNHILSTWHNDLGSTKPKFSFIVKLGAPTKIARLRHALEQQLFLDYPSLCIGNQIPLPKETTREKIRAQKGTPCKILVVIPL